jgi:hypothetical protein
LGAMLGEQASAGSQPQLAYRAVAVGVIST